MCSSEEGRTDRGLMCMGRAVSWMRQSICRAVRYIGAISVGPRAFKVCDVDMFVRAVTY